MGPPWMKLAPKWSLFRTLNSGLGGLDKGCYALLRSDPSWVGAACCLGPPDDVDCAGEAAVCCNVIGTRIRVQGLSCSTWRQAQPPGGRHNGLLFKVKWCMARLRLSDVLAAGMFGIVACHQWPAAAQREVAGLLHACFVAHSASSCLQKGCPISACSWSPERCECAGEAAAGAKSLAVVSKLLKSEHLYHGLAPMYVAPETGQLSGVLQTFGISCMRARLQPVTPELMHALAQPVCHVLMVCKLALGQAKVTCRACTADAGACLDHKASTC